MFVFYGWPFPHMYFAKNVAKYYFPFKFLAQFSATVSSFTGIPFKWQVSMATFYAIIKNCPSNVHYIAALPCDI